MKAGSKSVVCPSCISLVAAANFCTCCGKPLDGLPIHDVKSINWDDPEYINVYIALEVIAEFDIGPHTLTGEVCQMANPFDQHGDCLGGEPEDPAEYWKEGEDEPN